MPNPDPATSTRPRGREPADEAQRLADVVERLRPVLLHARRHSLPPADLEDTFSQAVLELLLRINRGARFASDEHAANALRLRFDSRITDRHRATGGRSLAARAAARAVAIDDVPYHLRAREDTLRDVIVREQLGELARAMSTLPAQQREALVCEIAGVAPAAARAAHAWSDEHYRKLRQRARHRLRALQDAA